MPSSWYLCPLVWRPQNIGLKYLSLNMSNYGFVIGQNTCRGNMFSKPSRVLCTYIQVFQNFLPLVKLWGEIKHTEINFFVLDCMKQYFHFPQCSILEQCINCVSPKQIFLRHRNMALTMTKKQLSFNTYHPGSHKMISLKKNPKKQRVCKNTSIWDALF